MLRQRQSTAHTMSLSEASTRIALAAFLHDIGKLAERARIEVNREQLEIWKQLDCPHWDGRPTHIHAAYTTAGFAAIEAHLPTRSLLMAQPFGERGETDADDSLINAAARHHRPETFLQWIIATADSLGGSGSRGYGKVKFTDLKLDGQPLELP